IHELAKEWAVAPKDLLTAVEKAGIRGKKSQSSLTDDEVLRIKDILGLSPRPAEPVGTERVVAERVVTERDSSAEQMVTAREQTTETRLRAGVIRRRTAREVLEPEELPPTVPVDWPPEDVPPPPGCEEMRGVKVLGKIDLRKPAPPPTPAPAQRPGEAAPSSAAADAGAPKKKKGRKVIQKSDMGDVMERDFQRGGKRPQKRR